MEDTSTDVTEKGNTKELQEFRGKQRHVVSCGD